MSVNPQRPFGLSPAAMFRSAWDNRRLIWQLTKREVLGRYRGSMMGLLWSFLTPLVMLAVYTFVFSVVFELRWGPQPRRKSDVAMMMFAGMIVHNLFAECASRAPSLILSNPSFVKRVVFPLEILPLVSLGSALFHTLVSLLVLLGFSLTLQQQVHWTTMAMPFVLLPLVLLTVGLSWFLASLGVYIRDVGHTIGLVVLMLLFLSPVIYPASAVPEEYRIWINLNPLTFIIEQTRTAVLSGGAMDWVGLLLFVGGGLTVAWLGFAWFQKTRRGFADVL